MAGHTHSPESPRTAVGKFTPYIPAHQNPPELTAKAIILGAFLALVFGIANAYLALKYGITVSASIPAAVMSMAILRTFFKRVSPLENNIVQTVGSSGESLAAGIAFTIPAFFIWGQTPALVAQGYDFTLSGLQIFMLSLLGGALGILFMIPLRRYLMEKEHGVLPFPEGTACAEIIIAGEEGGAKAKSVFLGMGISALYRVFMGGFHLWPEALEHEFQKPLKGGLLSISATPALFGVGVIIGPRIASYMLAGAVMGYLGVGPLLAFIGEHAPALILPPASAPLSGMGAGALRGSYIKYLGVGAVVVGGLVSLFRAAPTLISSLGAGWREIRGGLPREGITRTDRDIPMKWVLIGVALCIVGVLLVPGINVNIAAGVIAVIFGFLFSVVAARIVGQVGSSSSPVSGMTIATLLATAVMLTGFGLSGLTGMIATMMVGSVVCLAVCLSGDIAQDLKTGFLLGASPRNQQLMEFVGLLIPATVMGFMIFLLNDAFGFVADAQHPNPLQAPQANVMATLVSGLFGSGLPWTPILVGAMIAVGVEFLGIASLPFAIGLYLPMELSTPIMAGAIVSWLITKGAPSIAELTARNHRGTLVASGLVAGDSLLGVALAFLIAGSGSFRTFNDAHSGMVDGLTGAAGPMVSLGAFALMALVCWRVCVKRNNG